MINYHLEKQLSDKLFDMRLTQSTICKSIFENISGSIKGDYIFGMDLNYYEKDDLENSIALLPTASNILNGEYNIARFRLDVTIQVFQRYLNDDLAPDTWKRREEYLDVLDAFLNNLGYSYYKVDYISESGIYQHRASKGTIYEFNISGDARMIKETDEVKGDNC